MSEILDNLRAKYPQYDDIPDAELAYRITEKYPVYKDTDLLKDAMPYRAELYGEIKAAPSLGRQLQEEAVGHLRNLRGADVGEGVVETTKRQVGAAAGLLNFPFRAAGQAAGAAAAPLLRRFPGVDEREAARQREALETSVEIVPQVAGAAKAIPEAAQALLTRAPKAVPRPTVAPTEAPTGPTVSYRPDLLTGKPVFRATPEGVRPATTPLAPATPAALAPDLGEAGRIDPQTLFLLGRSAAGGLAGASQGETGIDRVRYGLAGAALGAALDPRLVGKVYRAAQKPLGLGASDMALGVAKWKSRANYFFTPKDIARGVPIADNLVEDAFAADDVAGMLRNDFMGELDTAVKALNYAPRDVRRVLQVLEGAQLQLTPVQTQIAARIRGVYDQMAQLSGTAPTPKISDMFKAMRDPTRGWGYTIYDLATDARNVSKKISNEGGLTPTGQIVDSFAARATQHLADMKTQNYPPEVIAYYSDYVNDLTKGVKQTKYTLLTPQMASRIKAVEFMRTIGLNLGSGTSNGLQQLNTLAKTSPQAFIGAYYDVLSGKKIIQMARDAGVTSEVLAKADIDTFANPTKLDIMLKHNTNRLGLVFRKVEEFNRLHAFAAGYRDATAQGLQGVDAIEYARKIVNDTQFRFGIENAPKWLRGASPEASVFGQFKSYQIQQTLFLKNLVLHDPVGAVKYLTGVAALAGTDAITGHHLGDFIRKSAADVFGGDPRDYKFRGLLGTIGIALGQQVGLGALPIENLQSLVFLVPGPAISHILDVASLVSNLKLSPSDAVKGEFGKKLNPDQWAALATRSLSVQLDKIRQAARVVQDGQMLKQARNLTEAFAGTSATGPAIRPTAPYEPVRRILGTGMQEVQEYGQARQEVGERVERWNELVKQKAEAAAAGDHEEVKRLNRIGVQEFGRIPTARKQTMKGARGRQRTPALERQLRQAPKPIRRQLREEAED